MYMNTVFVNDSLIDYKVTDKQLSIIGCGYYKLHAIDKIPTFRPKGRLDYQLLYIASGIAHFYFDETGKDTIVPAGSFVLFYPKDYQRYVYYGADKTEAYWIHFSGYGAKEILKKNGFSRQQKIYTTGTLKQFPELFMNIINELQQKKDGYEVMAHTYLIHLLINVARERSITKVPNKYISNQIEAARLYFNENYNETINIDEYASQNGMSISWFIRCFKSQTGYTPLQYILNLKLNNAQTLLESTNYTINEISNLVGYDNQLYFSRLFRKQKGMSPQQYRKSIQ